MLLAVLEARAGVAFSGHDVYLNVAGGLKITEPAADLAAAAALLSSLSGVAIPRHRVHFGEVSLSGAVNATPLMGPRLKEAQKLGFRQAVMPARGELDGSAAKLKLGRISHLRELADGGPPCD
jgi:DNA repair protein RadA/Sms